MARWIGAEGALGLELIDRSLLAEQSGRVPQVLLNDIDDGLRAVLGLS